MKRRTRIVLSTLTLFLTALACSLGQNPTSTESSPTGSATVTPATSQPQSNPPASGNVINPADLEYLGAFRLPGGEDPPQTFAYGGNAMTFNPDGDQAGPADGYPGSLFVMGHDRVAYGELPAGNQLAEIDIPAPIISRNLEDLNTAELLQGF